MKTTALLLLVTLCSVQVFSQDTLFTKTGEVIPGKVIEINQDQIKYKKSNNPDGPMYVANKSDIVLIEYKNGSKDVFSSSNDSNNTAVDNSNTNTNPAIVNNNSNNYYSNQNNGGNYGGGRSGVNVVIGASPYYGYRSYGYGVWGGGYRNYYRPYRNHYRSYSHFGHHCH